MSDVTGSVELELREAGAAVGDARLAAKQLANDLGATGDSADRLVLVVSELATSLVVHGGGGTITMHPRPGRTVLVTATTAETNLHGPAQASLGQGLSLVQRLAASVSIEPGHRITVVVGLA